ncbi:hypothetical protein SAMN05444144_108153 [Flavobacterium akiainvivens]|nr:hypothetical protein SAMN05444144_108153 [Flavobacterium akiainvivens]
MPIISAINKGLPYDSFNPDAIEIFVINTKPDNSICSSCRFKITKSLFIPNKGGSFEVQNITTKSLARAFVSFKESSQVIFAWFLFF